MARLRYNGLTAELGASLTNSATAATFAAALTHSGGTAVPTISGGNYIPLTILDSAGKVSEIVRLTAYTAGATTGTIARGQESTTGVSHASGDKVVHSATVFDATPTFDDLSDVDTTGVGNGYVPYYDLATASWKVQPGGGAVGSWENDQLVTFTPGTLSETTTGLFTASDNVFPAGPQHSLTVTSGMLATADKPVGFSQFLQVVLLFSGTGMTGGTSSTLFVEATYNGDVASTNQSINTTTSSRVAVTFVLRDAQVGDVITFRSRLNNSGFGNVPCVARGAACYASHILRAVPDVGGRFIYRDLVTGVMLLPPLVVSQSGTAAYQNARYCDNDVIVQSSTSSNPESFQQSWIPGTSFGVYGANNLWSSTIRVAASSGSGVGSAAAWNISALRTPATIRYDRLAIPVLP